MTEPDRWLQSHALKDRELMPLTSPSSSFGTPEAVKLLFQIVRGSLFLCGMVGMQESGRGLSSQSDFGDLFFRLRQESSEQGKKSHIHRLPRNNSAVWGQEVCNVSVGQDSMIYESSREEL